MNNLSYIHENGGTRLDVPEYLEHFGLSRTPFTGEQTNHDTTQVLDPADIVQHVNSALTRPGMTVVIGADDQTRLSIIEQTVARIDAQVPLARFPKAPAKARRFLADILESFGFEAFSSGLPEYRNVLAAFLKHTSQSNEVAVVVIERAEALTEMVLHEIIRLAKEKSPSAHVRIVFFGTRELKERVKEPFGNLDCTYLEMETSEPINVADYVFGRLNEAGLPGRSLFTPPAIKYLASMSKGQPDLINDICHRALESACADGLRRVSKPVLEKAMKADAKHSEMAPTRASSATVWPLATPGPAQRRYSSLIMTRGGKRISRFELTKEKLSIGRHKSNDIYIPRPGISLFHAILVIDGTEVFLFDLRSTNGTSVNGQEVTRRRLADGDVILFGSLTLAFCQGSSGISEIAANGVLPGFTETIVLEESEPSDPTSYLQSIL